MSTRLHIDGSGNGVDKMTVWVTTIWIALLVAAGLAVMIMALKNRRLIRTIGGSTVQGVCALAAVNVAGAFTGVSLGLNAFSIACCAIGGMPAVISLLLVKWIFGI